MGRRIQKKDAILDEIVKRLVREFKPEAISLFGSRARGDFSGDSDYDLMVIVSESNEPKYKRMQKAQEVLWGLWVSADILVWTRDEFENLATVVSSLPATVKREGKTLYAA